MRCDDVRLALSVRLDQEVSSLPDADVDAHVEGCPMCRAWLDGAERVTRVVRVQSVAVPDLTAQILAAVQADGWRAAATRPETTAVRPWGVRPRWALGLLAVVQLMIAVPDLLGVVGHDAHAGREVAAFDIALAVGLLVVAWYPEHARVLAPVAVTLVVCFASISALDILQDVVTPGRVATHVIAVLQAALVWMLARAEQRRTVAV